MIHGDMKLAQVLLKRPVALHPPSSTSGPDVPRPPTVHVKVAGSNRLRCEVVGLMNRIVLPPSFFSNRLCKISETAGFPFATQWTAAAQALSGEQCSLQIDLVHEFVSIAVSLDFCIFGSQIPCAGAVVERGVNNSCGHVQHRHHACQVTPLPPPRPSSTTAPNHCVPALMPSLLQMP